MPAADLTPLTISWTKESDLELRSYLSSQGMKKGDLSKFIEDAVRWRLFDQTVSAIKSRNADADPETIMEMIETTVTGGAARPGQKRQGGKLTVLTGAGHTGH
jgi:hypothetical protein